MSIVVNTFPYLFLKVLCHSLQHDGRNCCQFVPEVLFQVLYCPWLLYVHPALEIAPDEHVTGVEIGRSSRLFSIPSSWNHVIWKHRAENLHCIPLSVSCCPIRLKPESQDFNTKSLQIWFQICAEHLKVAGWIYCYCPTCLVFWEMCTSQPKKVLHHTKQ